jgi:hypothetical protein
MITAATRAYFAEIGRKGGRKSRRVLSSDVARRMVALRLARSAFQKYRVLCFWSSSPDFIVEPSHVAWVVEQLRRNGNRAAWQAAAKIEGLVKCP